MRDALETNVLETRLNGTADVLVYRYGAWECRTYVPFVGALDWESDRMRAIVSTAEGFRADGADLIQRALRLWAVLLSVGISRVDGACGCQGNNEFHLADGTTLSVVYISGHKMVIEVAHELARFELHIGTEGSCEDLLSEIRQQTLTV